MSIHLEEADIEVMANNPAFVFIDHLEIPMGEFCDIVRYVLTNTDLRTLEDPRVNLVETIKSFTCLPGYNKGAKRYGL